MRDAGGSSLGRKSCSGQNSHPNGRKRGRFLIPGACECVLTKQKGLCRRGSIKDLEMGDSPGLSGW